MPATLKNISKQPVDVILDHPAFLNEESGWKRTTVKFANTSEVGVRSVVEERRGIPGTLHLGPGEEVSLHHAIQHCSQVPSLLDQRVLKLTITSDRKAEEKA